MLALYIFLLLNFFLISASILVYAERKVSAYIHNRPGPNRVGPLGLLQPFADVIKLVFKEEITPVVANPFIHSLAPVIMVMIAMTTTALIPFSNGMVVADLNVGALALLGLTSIAVYGVTLAGWSSNSKYSLLGGLRSSAQMISYELSMGLAVVSVILMTGSLRIMDIVEAQNFAWNFLINPIGCIIFIITAFAETNRAPFDLPEAEQELVGGYHTEYSGMKFGMFFLAEYVNLFIASFFISTFFFGGYLLPFQDTIIGWFPGLADSLALTVLQMLSLVVKAAFFAIVFIWVRWTLPRFKYSQLMVVGWKYLLPIAVVWVTIVALWLATGAPFLQSIFGW
ncbi:MAG: NADH-quinone oxidoreductase subunit NuoH [Rhodothermales bacterium]